MPEAITYLVFADGTTIFLAARQATNFSGHGIPALLAPRYVGAKGVTTEDFQPTNCTIIVPQN